VRFTAGDDWIRIAYLTLAPLVGRAVCKHALCGALLASGQSSYDYRDARRPGGHGGVHATGGMAPWVEGGSSPGPWQSCPLSSSSACVGEGSVYRALDVEPGCAGTPTPVCNVPASYVRLLQQTDGAMRTAGSWQSQVGRAHCSLRRWMSLGFPTPSGQPGIFLQDNSRT